VAERDNKVLWPVAAAALLALAGVLVAVLWPDPPTSLRGDNPLHNSAGEGRGLATTGPYPFEAYGLCVAHGAVTLTGVDLKEPQHLVLLDWALSPSGSSASVRLPSQGRVADRHFSDVTGHVHLYAHRPVTNACSDPHHPQQGGQQLLVSVRRTAQVGSAAAIIVRSTSGTVTIPFSLQVCAKQCPDTTA
jgi:hypothetical protein